MLRFEEKTHTYYWFDKPVMNVSTALKARYYREMELYSNEEALIRGKYVHLATALYDNDNLDEDTLDPLIRNFWSQWVAFRESTGFVPDLVETRGYNSRYGYAGTLDRTGMLNGNKILLDIKTSKTKHKLSKAVKLQTAAYSELDNVKEAGPYAGRYGVLLTPDSFDLQGPWVSPNDFAVFVYELVGQKYKEERP